MNSTRTRTRRGTAAALTLLTAAGLGAAGAGASNATAAIPPQTREIASSTLGSDYKITLTALRSTEDEYAASVRLQVYTQAGGAWKESDRVTVGDVDGWFWYPLTGKGAVCQFSAASTEPAPLTVSLLLTPSLGCSDPVHYVVKQGRVYAG
ncbi:hypothetical protein [Streptomyces acidiscabies]|uniref:Secreted protein n=1 Tax=Streptomyces acidiscabies TaxID=42234 RepID=A0AAP6BAD8_9ACTN|nr:hypothetical protein [Streptomyces acidiscabies]MBP5935597.1 hypothetical protein [Streptomyces sp. LBUM 1476]MBZ3916518.1 hypothetical protein [Streptomyces acidiscabies]MDX2961109.1 hypothetical protein [Streptomyces acidiscabies]MDX3020194.1 hypothetical protein [Streptomyces acidiscabies]MDX3791816.1 hypothetical protein [Streptomyces acidiscabies]